MYRSFLIAFGIFLMKCLAVNGGLINTNLKPTSHTSRFNHDREPGYKNTTYYIQNMEYLTPNTANDADSRVPGNGRYPRNGPKFFNGSVQNITSSFFSQVSDTIKEKINKAKTITGFIQSAVNDKFDEVFSSHSIKNEGKIEESSPSQTFLGKETEGNETIPNLERVTSSPTSETAENSTTNTTNETTSNATESSSHKPETISSGSGSGTENNATSTSVGSFGGDAQRVDEPKPKIQTLENNRVVNKSYDVIIFPDDETEDEKSRPGTEYVTNRGENRPVGISEAAQARNPSNTENGMEEQETFGTSNPPSENHSNRSENGRRFEGNSDRKDPEKLSQEEQSTFHTSSSTAEKANVFLLNNETEPSPPESGIKYVNQEMNYDVNRNESDGGNIFKITQATESATEMSRKILTLAENETESEYYDRVCNGTDEIVLKSDSIVCCYSNIYSENIERRSMSCNMIKCSLENSSEKSSLWLCGNINCSVANADLEKDNIGGKKIIECLYEKRNLISVPIKCGPDEKLVNSKCRKIYGA